MGSTWLGNLPVSPPFDSFVGFPNQNKIGDYYTLVSDETGAHVAYAATFNGEQDVYYLRVFPAEPVPDIKANASDGPLVITTNQSCNIATSLDSGTLNGQPGEWWLYLLSSYGNFPLFDFPAPLFNFPETTLFDEPLPLGWYIFLFNVEDTTDGFFQVGWYDYVILVVQSPGETQAEELPNFDALIHEKLKQYPGK